ncbi:hypothetical protein GCM10027054_37060 [Isoptericola nanjingensis]
MLETVTGQTLYNQFIMDGEVDRRSWILVEGDDECHLLDGHLDREHFRTVPAHGKKNVVSAIGHFVKAGRQAEVLFVVDSDFDGGGDVSDASFVSRSRAYDLEAEILLLQPEIPRALVLTHCRVERRSPIAEADVLRVFELARYLASIAGALRWLAREAGHDFSWSKIPFAELVKASETGAAIQRLRLMTRRKYDGELPSIAEIRTVVSTRGQSVCSGHDLLGALAAIVGRRRGRAMNTRDFRSAFHAAVHRSALERASVYESAERWGRSARGISPWRELESGEPSRIV